MVMDSTWFMKDLGALAGVLTPLSPEGVDGWRGAYAAGQAIPGLTPSAEAHVLALQFQVAHHHVKAALDATTDPLRQYQVWLFVRAQAGTPLGLVDKVFAATLTTLEAASGDGHVYNVKGFRAPTGAREDKGVHVWLGTLPAFGGAST